VLPGPVRRATRSGQTRRVSGDDVVTGRVLSVNTGRERPIAAKAGTTGIDKRPVSGAVAVRAPGPKGTGGSGLAGDHISDTAHHGGDDQAVYAYAREDLDAWGL